MGGLRHRARERRLLRLRLSVNGSWSTTVGRPPTTRPTSWPGTRCFIESTPSGAPLFLYLAPRHRMGRRPPRPRTRTRSRTSRPGALPATTRPTSRTSRRTCGTTPKLDTATGRAGRDAARPVPDAAVGRRRRPGRARRAGRDGEALEHAPGVRLRQRLPVGRAPLGGKEVPWEESLRIPLVIRYDALGLAARTERRMALNVDLAPTVAAWPADSPPAARAGACSPS